MKSIYDSGVVYFFKKPIVYILSRISISVWATLHMGARLKVDLNSSVGRSILLRGRYESEVETVMRNVLNKGDIFVDVGANVGYFSVICSQIVGETGEIHSFEPHTRVYKLLQQSVCKNSIKNIRVNCLALSRVKEKLKFHSLKNSAFSWTTALTDNDLSDISGLIQAITLDEYVKKKNINKVSLIKIDVEGAEYNVVFGAIETLKLHKPPVVIEAQDWSLSRYGHTISDLFVMFNKIGYKAYSLSGEKISTADKAREMLKEFSTQNLIFRCEH